VAFLRWRYLLHDLSGPADQLRLIRGEPDPGEIKQPKVYRVVLFAPVACYVTQLTSAFWGTVYQYFIEIVFYWNGSFILLKY
jgi:hypothetical protein